jgi:hypothetical protein
MNAQPDQTKPAIENPWTQGSVADELTRVKIFLGIQAFFLVVSVFTGGFNFKLWSMLDTALMIQSIGVTALVVVLDEALFSTCLRCWIWGSTSASPESLDGKLSLIDHHFSKCT